MISKMRQATLFITMFAALTSTAAPTLTDIMESLDGMDCFNGHARFTVSLPQLTDDVVYDIDMTQHKMPADTLSGYGYLIDWTLTGREEPVKGFSAYFTGNHYRYSGERLQEYHMDYDPIPFVPALTGSKRNKGVHLNAQFVNILPFSVADELRRMVSDSAYTVVFHPDTLVSGRRVSVVSSVMRLNGSVAMEAEYVFSHEGNMPVRIRLENNPGAVSEQSVAVDYSDVEVSSRCLEMSEQYLMELYPTVFERFRQSNFRIENLPGSRLPGFALPTTTGERYSRRSGDAFRGPTVLVLLEAGSGFTPQVVSAVRDAVDGLPYPADAIWAFADNNVDAIEAVIPGLRPGEHVLMSAGPLVRDCGAASLPAVIITKADGVVADVLIGFNKDLASDVIQKMALLK